MPTPQQDNPRPFARALCAAMLIVAALITGLGFAITLAIDLICR